MNRPVVALSALLLAAPLSAFQPPLASHATSSRTQPTVTMAARSKEAEANIKKWGKILSQADTFDDKIKLKRRPATRLLTIKLALASYWPEALLPFSP